MTAPINLDLIAEAEERLREMAAHFRELGRYSRGVERMVFSDEAGKIMNFVARYYGVTIRDIRGKQRPNNITTARHVAMFIVRENCTSLSLSEIGRMFGNRDHGTVKHACDNVKNWAATDKSFASDISFIRANLRKPNDDGFINGDGI